jgi:hypothetical protein
MFAVSHFCKNEEDVEPVTCNKNVCPLLHFSQTHSFGLSVTVFVLLTIIRSLTRQLTCKLQSVTTSVKILDTTTAERNIKLHYKKLQGVQLKIGPYFNMSNLFTKIYNMIYYTTNLYLQ